MASIKISGYTFSTTSVPTTPALKVESGTGTYYVNLTTGQRPEALSDQKVFTISTTNYSFLRPFVTSNSLMGYSGVSNNSTITTGYSGVSNNSTVTTGYAGVTRTSSVDNRPLQVFRMLLNESTYSYDNRFISTAVFKHYNSDNTLISLDTTYYNSNRTTYTMSYASVIYIPDDYNIMSFRNVNEYDDDRYPIVNTPGHTYYTSPKDYHGIPRGAFSGDFQIYDYIPRNIFYTIHYKMKHTSSAAVALGWVYSGSTMPLRSSGYRPYTPSAGHTYTVGEINVYARTGGLITFQNGTYIGDIRYDINITSSGLTVSGTLNSSSTAVGNLSNTTALTNTATRYSSSTTKGYLSSITNLTKTATRYSSSGAVGNLSSTTELWTITRL